MLDENNIPYRIDSSNADITYSRNRIRANILPQFEILNPEYRKNMASFMAYASELQAYLDQQVQKFLGSAPLFIVSDFCTLTPFLQREVVRFLYRRANEGTIGLSE